MKRCPECRRDYYDDSLLYCLDDGTALLEGPASDNEPATAILSEPSQSRTPSRKRNPKLLIALAAVGLILIGGLFVYRYMKLDGSPHINSIAVLPFENRSGSADTDYLSDGLTDSLIFRFSQLPGLRVSPTSSVMRYKGKADDIGQIAEDLGVDAVLSGRLMQLDDDLIISVELVDARNKQLLWKEQYDRKMADLLATQREIATAIAGKLQLKLSGEDARGITKKYTNSNEAYRLYMLARYHADKRTKTSMLQGVDYYRQAIAVDPNFALAYARIAEVYLNLPAYPYTSPSQAVPEGKKAAEKALELDPELSEAHTYMGFYLVTAAWNWTDSEREFKRGIELDPNSADAHFRYGQIYLGPLGRNEEAVKELGRALELEPLNINAGNNFAGIYIYAGQNEQAVAQARKMYDLEPGYPTASFYLGLAYDASEKYDEAIALSDKVLRDDPANQKMLRVAGYAYAMSGRRADAERIIKRFAEIERTDYVMSYWVANIYAALGDKDRAFAELEKALANHDWELHRLKADALMSSLRGDPRYTAMLRRLNYPQ